MTSSPMLVRLFTGAIFLALLTFAVGQAVMASPGEDDPPGLRHELAPPDDPAIREVIEDYEIINHSRSLDLVIGEDERTEVTDTTQFPHSAIAYIESWDHEQEIGFRCSASFIGPDVLLTAAHCLWVPEFTDGWPDGVLVVPGKNDNQEPFGSEFAADVWVPDGWVDAEGNINQATEDDYGLIILDDDSMAGDTGQFEIAARTDQALQATNFNPITAGYPADKSSVTQWMGTQSAFSDVGDTHLVHDIDAFQGQSGSPVWGEHDGSIVGVISFETSSRNYALRITDGILDDLESVCQSMSCSVNGVDTEPVETETPTETATETPAEDPIETETPTETPTATPTGTATEPSPEPTDPSPPVAGDTTRFDATWRRTDQLVNDGQVDRTWIWGPGITDVFMEPYDEGPDGYRAVRYHEKSRMEINQPDADPNATWYVTNGLLVKELVTGELQAGNDRFEEREPADVNVAGDPNDPAGPTYATFLPLLDEPALDTGAPVTTTVDGEGNVGYDPGLAGQGVVGGQHAPETGHTVASVFWEFMNSSAPIYDGDQVIEGLLFESPYFATGLPITEAYWTEVEVGGTPRLVLVQIFERRVLTYTPGNPEGWEVEAGNVGQHYHHWRYEQEAGE